MGTASRAGGLAGLVGWLVLPTLVAMQFVDLRRGLDGHPALVSAQLLGLAALTVVAALPAWRHRRDLTRPGRWLLGSWLALVAWALGSSLVTGLPRITPLGVGHETLVRVQRSWLVLPVLTALVTTTAAWLLVLATPAARRAHRLWVAAVVVLATTPLAGARNALARGTTRLATGMGGSAVLHLALLLALAVVVAFAAAGHRRRLNAALALVASLELLATGSRAGLLCWLLFAALAGTRLLWRHHRRLLGLLAAGTLALLVAAVALVPRLRRLAQSHDTVRTFNLRGGLNALRDVDGAWLWGAGSGRVWPWYAFDAGMAPSPPRNMVRSSYGMVATNPHSLYLGVGVELGLVGALLLAVVLGTLVVVAVRSWRDGRPGHGASAGAAVTDDTALASSLRLWTSLAAVCALPAFALDHYLLKNFGVAFWWWVVLATAIGTRTTRRVSGAGSARS